MATYQQNQSNKRENSNLDLHEIVENMFMVLTDKEKEVVVRRYSLNNQQRETLEKIGKSFSVTRERVRQLKERALRKLRKSSRSKHLKTFLG